MSEPLRLDTVESAKALLEQWQESLAQVLESMTDQRPEVSWQALDGSQTDVVASLGADAEILWWEQPLQIGADMVIWVGSPRTTWEHAGTLTLKAAGLETVEISEARNTWFETLGQSLSVLARAIGSVLGREVTCEAGVERSPAPELQGWASVTLKFGDSSLPPLLMALSSKLMEIISAPPRAAEPEPREAPAAPEEHLPNSGSARSRTMDLLLDVDLPVSISFGRAQLPMKDVLKLTTGSIVELNRGIHEQVEVLVNHCLIARGEVVVVEGNYGVRIQEIVSRQDRLRSVR